ISVRSNIAFPLSRFSGSKASNSRTQLTGSLCFVTLIVWRNFDACALSLNGVLGMAATVGALQHRDSESGKSKPGRRKILLIEDDTALQQYVETILDRSKFAITAFTTAA